jgi:ABC-type dipeptide/oligopeptide/nickel transport system permease subunit
VSRALPWLGGSILAATVVAAVVGPWLGYDIVGDVDPSRRFASPSLAHWLGTDHLGRDVGWRMLLAARHFVIPGLQACAVCAAVGIPLGAASGWLGGPVSATIRYGFTVLEGLPRFVLVLLVLSIYGNDPLILAIVAGIAYAPTLGQAIHERLEGLRSAEYIAANRAHGVPEWRLLFVHLLWAACRQLIGRHLVGLFGFFLVLETTLSYLDYGVAQPEPSWGNMLAFDFDHDEAQWVPLLAPALAIWLVYAATTWVRGGLSDDRHG